MASLKRFARVAVRIWRTSLLLSVVTVAALPHPATAQTADAQTQSRLVNGQPVIAEVDDQSGQFSSFDVIDSAIKQPYNGIRTADPDVAASEFLKEFGGSFGLDRSNLVADDEPTPSATDVESNQALQAGRRPALQSFQVDESSVLDDQPAENKPDQSRRFEQQKRGLRVYGSGVVVRLDENAEVTGASVRVSSASIPSDDATVTRSQATTLARQLTQAVFPDTPQESVEIGSAELLILNPSLVGAGRNREYLAWHVQVHGDNAEIFNNQVFVDATNRHVLLMFDSVAHAMNRTVHDQQNNPNLPFPSGIIVRSEGAGPTGDADTDNIFKYTQDFYNFFSTIHDRDSIDGNGFPLTSGIRACTAKQCPFGAVWDTSEKVAAFGQGQVADDIVAHEFTHGFTEFTSGLIYLNESGAINESLSDVWGEIIDLSNASGSAGDDDASVRWTIGEDSVGGGSETSNRSMSNPTLQSDPDSMISSNYECGTGDFGGVHTNNGVNNKAASLIADGGSLNGYTISGIGLEKTARIYYAVQTGYLVPSSQYSDLGFALGAACQSLVGSNGITTADCQQVQSATAATHMSATGCENVILPYCASGTLADSFFDDFENNDLSSKWSVVDLVGTAGDWTVSTEDPSSGTSNLRGINPPVVSDAYVVNQNAVTVPANGILAFDHKPNLLLNLDGGVVELSNDGGSTWLDIDGLSSGTVYRTTLTDALDNPLAGRKAFSATVGALDSYRRTLVDLSSYAGQSVLFRFRLGSSNITSTDGWDIDDVRVYSCSSGSSNTAPVAVTDLVTVDEGGTATALAGGANSVLANDTDADLPGDALTATLLGNVTNGNLTLNSDGTFSYTHNGSETTTDQFTYTVSDQAGDSSTASVTITVTPVVDSPPVAAADAISLDKGNTVSSLDGGALSVLGNDTDADLPNDSLMVAVLSDVTNGNLTLNSDGSFSYTHDGSNTTADQFSYTVTDTGGLSASATVSITINPAAGSLPEMVAPSPGSTLAGIVDTFQWSENGSGATEWWLHVGSAKGLYDYYSANLGNNTSAVVRTLPVNGTDVYVRLWYRENGGVWQSIDTTYVAATTTLPSLTQPGDSTKLPGSTVTYTWSDFVSGVSEWWLYVGAGVGARDYSDSGLLPAAIVSQTVSGLPVDGSLVHSRLWFRTEAGPWQFTDQINVAATNSAPAGIDDAMTVAQGGTATTLDGGASSVLANDTDADLPGDTLSAAVLADVTNGTLTLNTDGTFRYVHDGSETASDQFTYTVSDLAGASSTATVTITINPAPVGQPSLDLPTPASTLASSQQAFSWSAGNGLNVTQWWLHIGSTSGGHELYSADLGTNTSVQVSGLPTDGSQLFVRLWYRENNGSWLFIEEQYTSATQSLPTVTSPVPGSVLISDSQLFEWTDSSTNVDQWWLHVGTSEGATDLDSSGALAAGSLSRTVENLPVNGTPIYVRLWYRYGTGDWQIVDSIFTASSSN